MAPRLARGRDLCGHIVRIRQLLVVQMAAFLRQKLILDMHGGRAGILETADHVHHVERFAISGVTVHQQRKPGGTGDLADEETDFVDGDHAEVGYAHGRSHRGAGQVQPLEPCSLGLKTGLAVMGTGHLQDAWTRQQRAKPLTRRRGG